MRFSFVCAVGFCLTGSLASNYAIAQTSTPDDKASGRKVEDVRKQKTGLLPPKEALEQKDADIAPDQYQPKGANIGPFVFLPKLEVDEKWTNNVFATNYNSLGDYITTTRPEFALNSKFGEHSLDAIGRIERRNHHRYDKESVTNGFAQLSGLYKAGERDTLNGAVSYTHDHEDRGSPDNAGGLRPTEFHYLTFNGAGAINTGRLTSSLGLTVVRRDWEDTKTSTGVVPSRLRNRWEYETKLREAYEIAPSYSLIGEGALIQRRYITTPDQAGYNRDSDGVRLSSGIAMDVSEVIRGDFLVGYFRQNYEDRRLQDPAGPFIRAMFNWTPTRLTTVIPSLERSVEETTATGVSSLVRTAAAVTVRHELQRNIILGSSFSYSKDEQKGGGLTANTTELTLRATYLLNEFFYTGAEFTQKHKLTNVDGSGFNQSTAMLRFGLQY
jgi:hypothetical protein